MNKATVTSAITLSAVQRAKVMEVLKEKYQVSEVVEIIDPQVLGGLKVTIGSKQIDLSVKNKLDALRK